MLGSLAVRWALRSSAETVAVARGRLSSSSVRFGGEGRPTAVVRTVPKKKKTTVHETWAVQRLCVFRVLLLLLTVLLILVLTLLLLLVLALLMILLILLLFLLLILLRQRVEEEERQQTLRRRGGELVVEPQPRLCSFCHRRPFFDLRRPRQPSQRSVHCCSLFADEDSL